MSLNPIPSSQQSEPHNWNYSNPNKPGYSTELVGTVYNIQEVQARTFSSNGPGQPRFWPDGNPVFNIRMILIGPNGGYRTWTFQPASRQAREGKRKSVHLDLFALTGNTDMMNLVGKTLRITTQEPPQGFSYSVNSPRPWHVELVPDVTYQLNEEMDPVFDMPKVLCDNAVHGGQTQPQPVQQPIQQMPQQMPVQQQMAPQMAAQPVQQTMPPQMQQSFQNVGVSAGDVLMADQDIPFN